MDKEQVQKLKHGLYEIYWNAGGSSLASVGSDRDGDRWLAPTNWTILAHSLQRQSWELVKKVRKINEDYKENTNMDDLKYGGEVRILVSGREAFFISYDTNYKTIRICCREDEEKFINGDPFRTVSMDDHEWGIIKGKQTRSVLWKERYDILADKWVEGKTCKNGFKVTQFKLNKNGNPCVINNNGSVFCFDFLRNNFLFRNGSRIEVEI